jgi:two-component system osmolarity sensor histidine kinase EnvZ
VFVRTAVTLALAFVLLQAVALAIIGWNITHPLGQRSAEDLAALMVLSAQTWAELPPATRAAFERELVTNHGLSIGAARGELAATNSGLPYRYLLEEALTRRTGHAITVRATAEPEWYWADIPAGGRIIRVGFARERLGVQPPVALTLLAVAAVIAALIAALVLARRLTRPLARLSQAAAQVGQGETPAPLPEDGPEELAQLARRFNAMARDVRALLDNRTTLLAGISHDLRTPLTRMQLALELLPRAADAKLIEGLQRDIAEMERLISEFLELGRGLHPGRQAETDLSLLLEGIVADARRGGGAIQLSAPPSCRHTLDALALRRVVANLVDNALRYGAGQLVEIALATEDGTTVIRVLDRGPGIPEREREAVFRPFYRLEDSRAAVTGGSGLGLAIARQLADANGWEIGLATREGGGTVARLRLPRASR